jgi:hypothetical protein
LQSQSNTQLIPKNSDGRAPGGTTIQTISRDWRFPGLVWSV